MGLGEAGFSHAYSIEWNKQAFETMMENKDVLGLGEHCKATMGDARNAAFSEFNGQTSLVAGGPPCQPFSFGGRGSGNQDVRDMWPEAIRAVREARPEAFLFENVKGLLRPSFSGYLDWIVSSLSKPSSKGKKGESAQDHLTRMTSVKKNEYTVIVAEANAANYGAAQKRMRVFIAGAKASKHPAITPPAPTHSRERLLWDMWVDGSYWTRHGLRQPSDASMPPSDAAAVKKLRDGKTKPALLPWRTCRDAFVGLGEPAATKDSVTIANHLLQPGARPYPGHTGSEPDAPAKALKAGTHGVPGGENMMAMADGSFRYFSIREAARLQGLPDGFVFASPWSESMRQLGNAVPVELAAAMASWIKPYSLK